MRHTIRPLNKWSLFGLLQCLVLTFPRWTPTLMCLCFSVSIVRITPCKLKEWLQDKFLSQLRPYKSLCIVQQSLSSFHLLPKWNKSSMVGLNKSIWCLMMLQTRKWKFSIVWYDLGMPVPFFHHVVARGEYQWVVVFPMEGNCRQSRKRFSSIPRTGTSLRRAK